MFSRDFKNLFTTSPSSERGKKGGERWGFSFSLTKGQRFKRWTLLSVLAVHRPFHISICISTLPMQYTTFISCEIKVSIWSRQCRNGRGCEAQRLCFFCHNKRSTLQRCIFATVNYDTVACKWWLKKRTCTSRVLLSATRKAVSPPSLTSFR